MQEEKGRIKWVIERNSKKKKNCMKFWKRIRDQRNKREIKDEENMKKIKNDNKKVKRSVTHPLAFFFYLLFTNLSLAQDHMYGALSVDWTHSCVVSQP